MKTAFIIPVSFVLSVLLSTADPMKEITAADNSVIIADNSVLFDYSVDDVRIYTNDLFDDGFEDEAFRFYPEVGGKYFVTTGRYDSELPDMTTYVGDIDLSTMSLSMQSYIIENAAGVIQVIKGSDYNLPPFDTEDNIREANLIKQQMFDVADSVISNDHYFTYVSVRDIYEYDTFYINSSPSAVIIKSSDFIGATKATLLISPSRDISTEKLKRYTASPFISGNADITYTETQTKNIQISKNENGLITLYELVEISGRLTPPVSIRSCIRGDVNGDGIFSISDAVILQKWLLSVPDAQIPIWQTADFISDCKLDVFDLCMMKKSLINESDDALIR